MKYEEWIRYEQQREAQNEIFAWVSIPEIPLEPNPDSPLASKRKTAVKQKDIFGNFASHHITTPPSE